MRKKGNWGEMEARNAYKALAHCGLACVHKKMHFSFFFHQDYPHRQISNGTNLASVVCACISFFENTSTSPHACLCSMTAFQKKLVYVCRLSACLTSHVPLAGRPACSLCVCVCVCVFTLTLTLTLVHEP